MVYTVNLTTEAACQLDNILSYLQTDLNNYQAMQNTSHAIDLAIQKLKHITDGFPPRPKFTANNKKHYIYKLKKCHYILVYHFENTKEIQIDGIFYTRQNYRQLFQ